MHACIDYSNTVQDPITCSSIDTSGRPCSLQNNAAETFEDSIWEYQLYAPPFPPVTVTHRTRSIQVK